MDFNTAFARNYELRKIILVNSASHAYSEIPINEPLALFGKNNRGKTSSLAATKLLLYPEVSLNDCEKKFNFTTKSGEIYSKEESYKHYFPTNESFIALEVSNPKNVFTMLLYRVGNYEYHRLFFPCEYSEIKPLIWNEETDYFSDSLGLDSLLKALKDMKGIQCANKKTIQKIMYGNFASSTSQYCIVPIKDQKQSSISAFIKMYELAFDAGKGEKDKLPNAIATIIEMQRGRENEVMDENVHGLKDKRAHLAAIGLRIKSLLDNEELYFKLQHSFDALHKDAQQAVVEHSLFNYLLNTQIQAHTQSGVKITQDKIELEAQNRKVSYLVSDLQRQIAITTTQTQSVTDAIKAHKNKRASAQTIIAQYPTLNKRQIVDKLQDFVAEYKSTAEALRSRDATAKRMTEKTREQNNLRKHIASLDKSLNSNELLLASQLPTHSASMLGSLNTAFLRTSIDAPLADKELGVIDDFVALFATDNEDLSFVGVPLSGVLFKPYDAKEQALQLANEISLAKDKMAANTKTIDDLNKSLSDLNVGDNAITEESLNKDINVLVSNIRLIEGLDLIEAEIIDKTQELEAKTLHLTALNNEFTAQKALASDINGKYVSITALYEATKRFDQDATIMTQMLSSVRSAHGLPYLSVDSPEFKSLLEVSDITIDIKTASDITAKMSDIQQRVISLVKEVGDFTRRVAIEGVDSNQQIDTLNQLGDVISEYKNSFSRLDWQQKNFQDEIKTHNNVIDGLLKEITDAAGLLRNTVSSLNKRLNEHQISNLKKVSLELNLSPDFANLERTYQKHNTGETSLLDESFYQSLIYYVERSSHSRSKHLKIRNLIESINYDYETKSGGQEKKSQSGGTTSTITALIATLLFSEVFLPDTRLKMPIIVDEIASLDKDNIRTIFEHVTQAGFTLICANPELHASTLRYIPRHVFVDKSVLQGVVKAHGCEFSVMPNAIQDRSKARHDHQ